MNDKDREVLEALTDYPHFTQFIKKVEAYARKKAFALDVSQDAALYAVDKVTDWLMKGDKVDHPASYVNAIMRYALIDYGRTNKPTYDVTQRDLVNIVGMENRLLADENEDRPTGWYAIKVNEKPLKNIKKGSLSTMSFFGEQVLDSLYALDISAEDEPNKMRQGYTQLAKQLNSIPGREEKRIMEYYLRGYRQREIVSQLDKKKEYVSRIIHKWLKIWGWGEMDVERSKLILLTHQLADLYRKLPHEQDFSQRLYHEVTSSFETKAYCSSLPESEREDLVKLCDRWVYDYAPKIEPDWWKYADNEAFESWQNEKKARFQFFRSLPKERRRDYVCAWREEAEYWKNNRLLNLVAELEKKLTS